MIVGIDRATSDGDGWVVLVPLFRNSDDEARKLFALRSRVEVEAFAADLYLAAEALWPEKEASEPLKKPASDRPRKKSSASWTAEARAAASERMRARQAKAKANGVHIGRRREKAAP